MTGHPVGARTLPERLAAIATGVAAATVVIAIAILPFLTPAWVSFEQGRAQAALQECPPTHPLAAAKGSDNIIAFTTERYARTPLVVQGPGAGADVTAMGVFSDILKLLHYLPE